MTHSGSSKMTVMLRSRLTRLVVISLTMTGSVGLASETKEHVLERSKALEEVVLVGVSACGSWPVRHSDIVTCEYAELVPKTIPRVRDFRIKLLDNCLDCAAGSRQPRGNHSRSTVEARFCQRVFWTPSRVGKVSAPIAATEPLQVDFTYAISRSGRVDDIVILDFEGNWSNRPS